MFSYFKKTTKVRDIEWLGVDIHSHLLPGIDDGSENMEQSINYIHQLQELGFSKLICTPHVYSDIYPNTPETILPVLSALKLRVEELGIDIKLAAAAEYMAAGDFVATDTLLTLPGNYILIEMSYMAETPNIETIIFDLQVKGYKVILAHPERYKFYHKHLERYLQLKERGCFLQLNILSALGYYGKDVQLVAEHLLKNRLYDFTGTDLHHARHLQVLSQSVLNGLLYEKLGSYGFSNKEVFN